MYAALPLRTTVLQQRHLSAGRQHIYSGACHLGDSGSVFAVMQGAQLKKQGTQEKACCPCCSIM